MIARLLVVLMLALAVAAPAAASERHPTLAQLEHEVMCPTCHTLLELSHAPIAQRMRAFIRRRIAAGDTDGQIKTRLVAEFGEGVLAAPPARGFGLLAWLLPLAGLLGVGVVVGVIAYRWKHGADADDDAVPASPPLDPELARRLDQELAHFDA